MKKNVLILMLAALPLASMAQDNVWEQGDDNDTEAQAANPDAKYLSGAVPEVEGKVVFSTTVQAPGKTRAELYAIVKSQIERLTKGKNQLERTAILTQDSTQGTVRASFEEWLVFAQGPFYLDRTRLYYVLSADCNDGEVELSMKRIHYLYEEERDPQRITAEEWITDQYGLNKKKTALSRMSGKFRRKTIDRKDYIFGRIARAIGK